MKRCPGPQPAKKISADRAVRITAEGSASQYHLSPAHPHLFCGCGNEAAACHPGRCCRNDEWDGCLCCRMPGPDPEPTPECELSEGLWE